MYNQLLTKIEDKTATAGVIGLGYVGLPMATGLAKCNYKVTGIDASQEKVNLLNNGTSYIPDVPTEEIAELVKKGLLSATTDYASLQNVDVIFICVPTPFDSMKAPDLAYVRQASEGIATNLQRGQLIVLQSTTYPGTTEEVVQPILEKTGMLAGQDFFLAFSPERIDPWPFRLHRGKHPKSSGRRWSRSRRSWPESCWHT